MAKLVSQPYEQEEQPHPVKPAPVNQSDTSSPVVTIVGLLIIVCLFLGALYLVIGAFSTQSPRIAY